MQGVLLVDKPAGWTSFDVVNYVRKIIAQAEGNKPKHVKVGHTGTLDPFATGLLVILVGKTYTRQAQALSKVDKTYRAEVVLGKTSSTGDPEGEIATTSEYQPSDQEVGATLTQFQGEISQVPPAFSAIKVNGQRAYKLARAGKAVEIAPRAVTIHALSVEHYAYPELTLQATVSSGTYIRTLVEDIGKALKTGAYTVTLQRLAVGAYKLDEASEVTTLTAESIEQQLKTIP